MKKHKGFTDLEVYRECRKFRKEVSEIVKDYFPKKEQYLLSAQILDAARSVSANIAEGHGRFYYQDNIKFCRNARGSLEEALEHLITTYDEKYIDTTLLKKEKVQYEICLKLINGYIRYLRNSKRGKADDES